MSARLGRFDKTFAVLVDERGRDYGDPRDNFDRIQKFKAVIAECKDPLAREALEMIAVKVSRLIESPDHLDSWIDIANYARTGVMVTDGER